MTGTGTQENPYIITTAAELMNMNNSGSRDKYFKLGNDIDFSNTVYAENFVPITLLCRCFDGNGHTIRGIYKNAPDSLANVFYDKSSSTAYTVLTIKNLTVEADLIGKNTKLFNYTNSNATYSVQNCKFILNFTEGDVSTESLINSLNLKVNFSYCTIILNADLHQAHSFMKNGSLTSCQVRSNTVLRASDSAIASNALWYDVDAADTGFFGRISIAGSDSDTVLWAHNGIHSNCYQVLEYNNIAQLLWNGSISTVCFYDSDKAGNTDVKNTADSGQNALIHGLATKQCKDAEYLKSIGYVCEGAE